MNAKKIVTTSLILLGLAGVGVYILWRAHSPNVPTNSSNSAQSTSPGWIFGAYALKQLSNSGASKDLLNQAFNNDRSFVFGDPNSIGMPTASYQSYEAIKEALASGTLPGKYRAVVYDNEHWSFTPISEQQDPDTYEQKVGSLLHQHGLLYIATPAADIVRASGAASRDTTQDLYLKRNIAGGAARYADVIDIQAQYLEPDLSKFTSFATTAAKQARDANPKIKIYIGISTGPDGQVVSYQQLYDAYQAVKPIADGYWLNISGHSAYCPNCTNPKPELAVQLLQAIYMTH